MVYTMQLLSLAKIDFCDKHIPADEPENNRKKFAPKFRKSFKVVKRQQSSTRYIIQFNLICSCFALTLSWILLSTRCLLPTRCPHPSTDPTLKRNVRSILNHLNSCFRLLVAILVISEVHISNHFASHQRNHMFRTEKNCSRNSRDKS